MISLRDVRFEYAEGGFGLKVPDLEVARGEKVALVGPSGSGKTTLISLIAGILRPDAGSISLDGTEIARLGDAEIRRLRISKIGFIFQEFELLEYLTALENVLLPYYVNSALSLDAERRAEARSICESMGLGAAMDRRPGRLSQGERQRVAICRALVTRPPLIIADEPTGNLDPGNKSHFMQTVMAEVSSRGATLVVVTHDSTLLDSFDKMIDVSGYAGGGGHA